MKLISFATRVYVLVFGITLNTVVVANNSNLNTLDTNHIQTPSLQKDIKIDVWAAVTAIDHMVFSPDNRYLAVVLALDEGGRNGIVIWDLHLNKLQSHIYCPVTYILNGLELMWSSDNKSISLVGKDQWNPLTGEALPDRPLKGGRGRLNKDGSKMLVINDGHFVGGGFESPYSINVYDTKTWTLLNEIPAESLRIDTAEWTAEDKILVAVSPTRESLGKTIDGRLISDWNDSGLRLLEPGVKEPIKAVWYPPVPSGDPNWPMKRAIVLGKKGMPIFATNQIMFSTGILIDGTTLDVRQIDPFNDKESIGSFGMGVSPNGQLLYLKGAAYPYGGHIPVKNSIVDINSGKILTQFDDGIDGLFGLAISPDGKTLALGGDRSNFISHLLGIHSLHVLIFDLQ